MTGRLTAWLKKDIGCGSIIAHTNGDTQVGDIAVRMGRVRVDVEEIDAKLVLAGIVKRASER